MSISAWNSDAEIAAAGYVIAPEGRYVDEAHGIDWAVIVWCCRTCHRTRSAPGPGEPPHCHGPMEPLMSGAA